MLVGRVDEIQRILLVVEELEIGMVLVWQVGVLNQLPAIGEALSS